MIAMDKVMAEEYRFGNTPCDVSAQNVGYDIESIEMSTGHLRFIEVKGRIIDGTKITVTRNEILTALNKPEHFIYSIVQVDESDQATLQNIRQPLHSEPDFGATSVTYRIRPLVLTSEVVA